MGGYSVHAYAALADSSKVIATVYVRHSQSILQAKIRPWVAAEQSGTIICAHYTCMAGLGGACSHIAIYLALCCRKSHSFSKKHCLHIITMWLASSHSKKCHLQFTNLLVILISLLQRQKRKNRRPASFTSTININHDMPTY